MIKDVFTKDDTLKVKGIAIILMFIHHCFLGPERYEGQIVSFAPFSEAALNKIALSFKICVAIFTFLSAYGITLSYRRVSPTYDLDRKTTSQLVAKRLVALIMGFFFVLVLSELYGSFVVRDGRFLKVYLGDSDDLGRAKVLVGCLRWVIDALGLAELFSTPTYLATFWYMSLAIAVVFLMPIMLEIYRRYGTATLLFLAILVRVCLRPVSDNHMAYIPNYLFCVAMGIWAADKDLIVRFANIRFTKHASFDRILVVFGSIVLAAIALYIRQKMLYSVMLAVWDGVIPFLVCVVMFGWVNRLPGISLVLSKLGVYSMNMFLVHNFVRVMWYYDFTYSFKAWWLITIVLLAVSFVVAVVIEWLKRFTRYDRFVTCLRDRVS